MNMLLLDKDKHIHKWVVKLRRQWVTVWNNTSVGLLRASGLLGQHYTASISSRIVNEKAEKARISFTNLLGPEIMDKISQTDGLQEELICDSLSALKLPNCSMDNIEYALEKMNSCFNRNVVDGADELTSVKMVVLGYCCIDILQAWLNQLLQASYNVTTTIKYWETRLEQKMPFWYLYEKTPWFWVKYFTKADVSHPIVELKNKLKALEELKKVLAWSIGRILYQLLNSQVKFEDSVPITITNTVEAINEVIVAFDRIAELFPNSDTLGSEKELSSSQLQKSENQSWLPSAYEKLTNISRLGIALMEDLSKIINNNGIPNWWSTHWVHIALAGTLVYFSIRKLYDSRQDITDYIKDTYLASIRFWHEHLEEPLSNIWATVRYDKTTLSVVDPISLEKSADSLVRMVMECYEDHGFKFTADEAIVMADQVRRGDITEVMKLYESDIRHPIKSALFGDLIRTILIQVQKEKVDVERALGALDQLLKANELNFQFLATIPAVLLLVVIAAQLRKLLTINKSYTDVHNAIKSDMRGIERMLNIVRTKNIHPETASINGMSLESYGYLLHITSQLYYFAEMLPAQQDRFWFEEDVEELESEETNATQKLATIQRMYHTHTFLLPSSR